MEQAHPPAQEVCLSVTSADRAFVGRTRPPLRRRGSSVCRGIEFPINSHCPATSTSRCCLVRNWRINKLPLIIVCVCSPKYWENKILELWNDLFKITQINKWPDLGCNSDLWTMEFIFFQLWFLFDRSVVTWGCTWRDFEHLAFRNKVMKSYGSSAWRCGERRRLGYQPADRQQTSLNLIVPFIKPTVAFWLQIFCHVHTASVCASCLWEGWHVRFVPLDV